MTEINTSPASSELDLDSWLAGGSRNTQIVTLYARNDLHAQIVVLEKKLLPETKSDEPDPDASLGDVDEVKVHNDAIHEQINELWVELDKSRREFRVAGRTSLEVAAIKEQVEIDLKDELDAAAVAGRATGKSRVDRLGVKLPEEINRIVRAGAIEAMDAVRLPEIAARTIADSTTIEVGGIWHPVSKEQVRSLQKSLGEPAVDLLARAASRTAVEAPLVTVPKS